MRLKKGLVFGLALALAASVLSVGATTTEAATKKKTIYNVTSTIEYADMMGNGNLELTHSWECIRDKYGYPTKTVNVTNNIREEKNYKITYKNNRVIKSVCDDGTYEEYSYKKTKKGGIVQIKKYTNKKKLISTTTNTDTGNKFTTVTKVGSKTVEETVSKTINGKSKLISQKRCDDQGKLLTLVKFTYDKYGNVLTSTSKFGNNTVEEKYTYKYDGKIAVSAVCEIIGIFEGSNYTDNRKKEITYYTSGDEIGQVKTEKEYYSSGDTYIESTDTRYEYKMDKHGNVLESVRIDSKTGNVVGKSVFTYKAIKVAI